MDYEKKYNETLERAKKFRKKELYAESNGNLVEYIFPELAESEDERIRKALIKFFTLSDDNADYQCCGVHCKDIVAWLEKQGEQPKKHDVCDYCDQQGSCVSPCPMKLVEKQGEQKPVPKFKVGDTMRTLQEAKDGWTDGMPFVVSIDSEYYNCNSEKIAIKDQDEYEYPPMNRKHDICVSCDEQKSANKINQEWIPQTGDTFRKKGTTSPTYHLCNKREDGITFDFVENREVGIAGGEITIFALRQDYELVERPKSAEDVVEEELNRALQTKVEQNPAWSEEDIKTLNRIAAILVDASEVKNWWKEYRLIERDEMIRLTNFLKSIKERVQPQPKQEWGEEDERMFESALWHIKNSCGNQGKNSGEFEVYNWAKSLKQRVQPQQEWSEEDEHRIKDTIYFLETAKRHYASTVELDACIDWLKSLRPQSKQEWSEEDKEMIDWLIRCCEEEHKELCNDRYGHQEIVSDLKRDCRKKWDWLESLKNKVAPQSHWKPNGDQLDALYDMLCSFRKESSYSNRDEIADIVETLCEQLKAL